MTPTPDLPLSKWAGLRGERLFAQLELLRGRSAMPIDRLRTTVANLAMLRVKMDDPALAKWFDAHVPTAMKRAGVQARVDFLSQGLASGLPARVINRWMPEGWGTVGGQHSPLTRHYADRTAFEKRLAHGLPGARIVSAPALTSFIALPKNGEPIRLSAAGQTLSLAQGSRSFRSTVPVGASAVQLDGIVADLISRLSPDL